MQDIIYTFGDTNSTWICVHLELDIYTDGTKWAEFDHQATSMAQLNDTLLARGVPCIFQPSLCQLKVYCKDQRAQTMLLLSTPGGLWCGEPRRGAHIATRICDRLLVVAAASKLIYTCSKRRKFAI